MYEPNKCIQYNTRNRDFISENDKHLSNAKTMLEYLSNHDGVEWVSHPDLPDHPDHEVAKKMLPKGAGSMIAFGVKGGRKAGEAFINAVKLASNLANVGDSKTLVIHPASTTHAQICLLYTSPSPRDDR